MVNTARRPCGWQATYRLRTGDEVITFAPHLSSDVAPLCRTGSCRVVASTQRRADRRRRKRGDDVFSVGTRNKAILQRRTPTRRQTARRGSLRRSPTATCCSCEDSCDVPTRTARPRARERAPDITVTASPRGHSITRVQPGGMIAVSVMRTDGDPDGENSRSAPTVGPSLRERPVRQQQRDDDRSAPRRRHSVRTFVPVRGHGTTSAVGDQSRVRQMQIDRLVESRSRQQNFERLDEVLLGAPRGRVASACGTTPASRTVDGFPFCCAPEGIDRTEMQEFRIEGGIP